MQTRWGTGRRAVLTGAGAACLLAACGSSEDGDTQPAAVPPPATSPSTEAPKGLADTADVPVGGGKVVDGVLLTQPVAGSFKAFDAACPHKGVQVAAPKDGVANCPAHNSNFSITDGARTSGPATSGLKEIAITVTGNRIVRA